MSSIQTTSSMESYGPTSTRFGSRIGMASALLTYSSLGRSMNTSYQPYTLTSSEVAGSIMLCWGNLKALSSLVSVGSHSRMLEVPLLPLEVQGSHHRRDRSYRASAGGRKSGANRTLRAKNPRRHRPGVGRRRINFAACLYNQSIKREEKVGVSRETDSVSDEYRKYWKR